MQNFQNEIRDAMDVRHREIGSPHGVIHLYYIEELCDSVAISRGIVSAFAEKSTFAPEKEVILRDVLRASAVGEIHTVEEAMAHLLVGDSVLLFDFLDSVIYCETKKIATRPVGESKLEPTLKGPKEAFNELLPDNLALVRKRVADKALRVEFFTVGGESRTLVAFLYLNGVAPSGLVGYVRQHITGLHSRYILSNHDIQENMSLRHTTLDTIGYTEKPDTVVSRLYEGRVAVIVNGCPLVLTAPHFFVENFHSSDDYYSNRLVVNFIRVLRSVSFFVSLLLPGFFVALSTFHFSLIPTTFMLKLAVQRSGVPLPTVAEVITLQFFFELARESGKQIPQQVGQSISIVAALILGEAAVGAGVTSEATVVVTGVYAVCSFLNPKLAGTTYVWSLFIVVVSSILGLYGFYLSFVVFLAHVSSLESCGYPFLFPLGTVQKLCGRENDIIMRSRGPAIKKKIVG